MLCGVSTLQANVISPIVGYVQTPAGDYQGLSIDGWACHKGRSESVAIDVYAGKDFANASHEGLIIQVLLLTKNTNGHSALLLLFE